MTGLPSTPREAGPAADASSRVALVTGASAGIGAATARVLAREGWTVVVNARTVARAQAVVDDVVRAGGSAVAVASDVSVPSEVDALFGRIDDTLGRLDVLVNNAGRATIGPAAELSLEDWDRTVALNLTAPFLCAQRAHPRLRSVGGGTIVNVTSLYGSVGAPDRVAYVSTKHALAGMTRALATEWGPDGIRVLSVAPAYVETEMIAASTAAGHMDRPAVLARTPLGRLASPDEVAEVIAFAVSDRARYMTGSTLAADGGWLAFGGA